MRGGLTECYGALFLTEENHSNSLYFYDKDGQYGYIAMISEFPISDYEVSINKCYGENFCVFPHRFSRLF